MRKTFWLVVLFLVVAFASALGRILPGLLQAA